MTPEVRHSFPCVVVRPDGLVFYNYWNGPRRANSGSFLSVLQSSEFNDLKEDQSLKVKKAYTGLLTKSSRKKLAWYINCLVAAAQPKQCYNAKTDSWFEFRVNFITLTLPAPQGKVTDKEIKSQCLSRWIDTMRASYQLNNYVWRAERQFNGNIHFHITTDTYIPWDRVLSVWNHYLSRFHFIDEFRKQNESEFPNSTDIHSVQKIKDLAPYLVKYCSKEPELHLKLINAARKKKGLPAIIPENHPWRMIEGQPQWNDPIQGRLWDASTKLKNAGNVSLLCSGDLLSLAELVVKDYPERCFSGDHCLFVEMPDSVKKQILPGYVQERYYSWLRSLL